MTRADSRLLRARLLAQAVVVIPMLILFLTLSSCSSIQVETSAKLALETQLADALLQAGTPQEVVLTAELTEQEAERVLQALSVYTAVRGSWDAYAQNPQQLVLYPNILTSDYARLYAEYQVVYQIVQAHWQEYPPAQRAQLLGYHSQATAIHAHVQTLLVEQQRADTVAAVLDLGLTLVKIAAAI